MNTDPRNSAHPTQSHAIQARQAVAALIDAKRSGDQVRARRSLSRLRRHLEAHLSHMRSQRSQLP